MVSSPSVLRWTVPTPWPSADRTAATCSFARHPAGFRKKRPGCAGACFCGRESYASSSKDTPRALDGHRGGDRPQHLAFRDRGPAQFLDNQPVDEGQHAVTDTDEILDVGGADHEPDACLRVLAHEVVDRAPCPDVNAACRVLHEHDPRLQPEPLRHQDLLLVTTAEQAVQPVRVRWPDIQPLDPLPGRGSLSRLVDPPRLSEVRHPAERDVLAHREVGNRSTGMAVRQYESDPQLPRQPRGHGVSVYPLTGDIEAHGSGTQIG